MRTIFKAMKKELLLALKWFLPSCLLLTLSGCPSSPPPPENFAEAKAMLEQYVWHDQRQTLYCGASYDERKNIRIPAGFSAPSHEKRAARMEWEHAVPAENFGRAFPAWRDGDPVCVKNGKAFRGRRCAEKASPTFRKMEADMYNLFPAIGAVNAARSNRQYDELPDESPSFGSCPAKVAGNSFEPPDKAKGQVARAALYMDKQYAEYRLSRKQRRLFNAWNSKFPPDRHECERGRRIASIQGNANAILKEACAKAGFRAD